VERFVVDQCTPGLKCVLLVGRVQNAEVRRWVIVTEVKGDLERRIAVGRELTHGNLLNRARRNCISHPKGWKRSDNAETSTIGSDLTQMDLTRRLQVVVATVAEQ
jgi:hypothetical protein